MKVVVDSNQLQSAALRAYLEKSRSNAAVLTDYAAMEAYKGNTRRNLGVRSFKIVKSRGHTIRTITGSTITKSHKEKMVM